MILIVLVKQIRGLHTVAQPVRKAGPPNCQWEALDPMELSEGRASDLSEAWPAGPCTRCTGEPGTVYAVIFWRLGVWYMKTCDQECSKIGP